jgi:hypothetical protein
MVVEDYTTVHVPTSGSQ